MNDQYLKMVLALPEEFFKGWEWKEGDQFFRYNKEWNYMEIQGYVGGDYSLYHHAGKICYVNETGDYVEGELTPLPNFQQLLHIYETKNDLQNESMSLLWLANWIEEKVTGDHGFCFKYESAEAIALVWVQETCFNQKWDGKEWI